VDARTDSVLLADAWLKLVAWTPLHLALWNALQAVRSVATDSRTVAIVSPRKLIEGGSDMPGTVGRALTRQMGHQPPSDAEDGLQPTGGYGLKKGAVVAFVLDGIGTGHGADG
jgi:hypothetical protein